MGTLVDSSVFIEAERGRLNLDAILGGHPDDAVGLAAITASELLHGVHRLRGVRRIRAEQFVERVLSELPVAAFDRDVARTHAALAADLAARGAMVGAHDLLIAATAVHLDWSVATRDARSFPRVKGLDVIRW